MYPPEHTFPPLHPKDPATIGPYRTVGRLGSGGMGAVYAATDRSGGVAAVKLVHGDLAADRDFRARFAREAALVQRVASPCVPRFLGSDTRADQPWLATGYAPGPTLRQHVRENGPLTGPALHAFAAGIAEALSAIHAAGIVHRDLKPGNVILGGDGPKVLDFGIARALDETAITRTGGLFGTPGWVAPELLRGAAPSPAADVFAWGGLIAFAATGRDPFGRGSAETVALRVLEGAPDLDGVPEGLMALVAAATGKDPAGRPTVPRILAELLGSDERTLVAAPEQATLLVTGLLRQGWEAPPPPTHTHAPRPSGPGRPSAPSRPPPRGRSGRSGRSGPSGQVPRGRRLLVAGAAAAVLVLVTGGGWYAGILARDDTGDPASDPSDPSGTEGETATGGGTGEVAVSVPGTNAMIVYADDSGALEAVDGFAGPNYDLPDGVERDDHVVASFTVTVGALDASGMGGDGVRVFVQGTYVADEGQYTLHADDFTLYGVPAGLDRAPDDPGADGLSAHQAPDGGVLARMGPDEPDVDVSFEVPDAPGTTLLAYLPDPARALGEEHADDRVQGAYMCATNWTQVATTRIDPDADQPCPTMEEAMDGSS